MNNQPIVFFDSGIGGLTVLAQALEELPNHDYIYYADSANLPYGTKSAERIKELVLQAFQHIEKKNPKAVVVACNTATSVAIQELRSIYKFPIIGMEPAIKPAVAGTGRVLITATDQTLKGGKLKKLVEELKVSDRISFLSLQELVLFAEKLDLESAEIYLHSKFKEFNLESYSGIVLGCTHFIFFKNLIRKILPANVQIFDGNKGTVQRLKTFLDLTQEGTTKREFIISGKSADFNDLKIFFDFLSEHNS